MPLDINKGGSLPLEVITEEATEETMGLSEEDIMEEAREGSMHPEEEIKETTPLESRDTKDQLPPTGDEPEEGQAGESEGPGEASVSTEEQREGNKEKGTGRQ